MDEQLKYKAILKRIQNERKAGFGTYIAIGRKPLLWLSAFFLCYLITGMVFSDVSIRMGLSLLGSGAFMFFYYYPNYPEEYYKKETSLFALSEEGYRRQFINRLRKRLGL